MNLQLLAKRAPYLLVATIGAGAILGCAACSGLALYLTKPREVRS